MTDWNDWAALQDLIKKVGIAMLTVEHKEKDVKDQLNTLLRKYYLYKRKTQLISLNNQRLAGTLRGEQFKNKIKVKIISDENILSFYLTVKDYLFEFRSNTTLLHQFILSLKPKEQDIIANVFAHYFFENVTCNETSVILETLTQNLIDNSLAFQPEICDENFLAESSFLSKFLIEIGFRNEVKVYLSHILSETIKSIEAKFGKDIFYLTFTIETILELVAKKGELPKDFVDVKKGIMSYDSTNNLRKSTTKSLKKNEDIFGKLKNESKLQASERSKNVLAQSMYLPRTSKEQLVRSSTISSINEGTSTSFSFSKLKSQEKMEENNKVLSDSEAMKELFDNRDVINDIYLKRKIKNEKSEFMKQFYLKHMQEIGYKKRKHLFSRIEFQYYIINTKYFGVKAHHYLKNLNILEEATTQILDNIISTMSFVPRIIKKTAQMIYSTIKKKFGKDVSEFELGRFISKFYFEKIITPTLLNPEKNELISPDQQISENCRKSLIEVALLLKMVSSFEMFSNPIRSDHTLMNPYIIKNVEKVKGIIDLLLSEEKEDICSEREPSKEIYQTICLSVEEINVFKNHFYDLKDYFKNKDEYSQIINYSRSLLKEPEENYEYFFLFIKDNFDQEREKILKVEKEKEKISLALSKTKGVLETKKCINHVLGSVPSLKVSESKLEVVELFQSLNKTINYHDHSFANDSLSKLPTFWYSEFIVENIENLPYEYTTNNYNLLYKELSEENEKFLARLSDKNVLLSTDMTKELETLKKNTSLAKYQLDHVKKLELTIKVFFLIKTARIEVCLMSGREIFEILYQTKASDLSKKAKSMTTNELILKSVYDCDHQKAKELGTLAYSIGFGLKENTVVNNNHCTNIASFIARISLYKDKISNDIVHKLQKTQNEDPDYSPTNAKEAVDNYIESLDDFFRKQQEFKELISSIKEKKIPILYDKMRNYILSGVSNSLGENENLKERDKKFYETCCCLQFIDPVKHFDVNPSFISKFQLKIAQSYIEKMDQERYCKNIIDNFSKSIEQLVKMINFATGKEDASVDDFIPLVCYLIIQAKPKRMISNFGNCIYFIDENSSNQNTGFTLANIEISIGFIQTINPEKAGMKNNEKEFYELYEECRKQYLDSE